VVGQVGRGLRRRMFFEVGRGAAHYQAQRPQAASDEGRIGRRERADPQIERLLHQVDHRVVGAQIDRRFRVPGQEIADNRSDEPPDALVAIDAQLATRRCLLRAGFPSALVLRPLRICAVRLLPRQGRP
jgi:hypothetical protein